MTSLTFYGGVNEIGGNKILLEDKDTRVFFDFGQSFNFGNKYFTSWLSPRRINGLRERARTAKPIPPKATIQQTAKKKEEGKEATKVSNDEYMQRMGLVKDLHTGRWRRPTPQEYCKMREEKRIGKNKHHSNFVYSKQSFQ